MRVSAFATGITESAAFQIESSMATNYISTMTDIIAERQLVVEGEPGKSVVLTIGKPCPDPRGDWVCPVEVQGVGESQQLNGYGVDAVQALMNALEAARYILDQSGLTLTWPGGEPGDAGIPRLIPASFGLVFARKIEAYIDREVEDFAKAAERSGGRAG